MAGDDERSILLPNPLPPMKPEYRQLIAGAPRLFAALLAVVEAQEATTQGFGTALDDVLPQVQAALASATVADEKEESHAF